MDSLTLVFHDLKHFPSLNVIMREHYMTREARINSLCWLIRSQIKSGQSFDTSVIIEYSRYAGRYMDWDNFGASFKFVGDALVRCGIIKDDSPYFISSFRPMQYIEKDSKKKRVEIKIVRNI